MTIGELIALPFQLLALIPVLIIELIKWVLDLPASILVGAVVVGIIIYWVFKIVAKSLDFYDAKTTPSQKETVNKSISNIRKFLVKLWHWFIILIFAIAIISILLNIFAPDFLNNWNS